MNYLVVSYYVALFGEYFSFNYKIIVFDECFYNENMLLFIIKFKCRINSGCSTTFGYMFI